MILHWLYEHLSYKTLGSIYGVSKATISRDIHWILPKLYAYLDHIQWPSTWLSSSKAGFGNVVGAIDCTSHFRFRVHPRQADWYSGDKGRFFHTAQVVTTLTGEIVSVIIGLGHNNDSGMFKLTQMSQLLLPGNLYLLADSGYGHSLLVTPDDQMGVQWNHEQKAMRSIVEISIGMVGNFGVASEIFKQSPELQQIALMCAYQLTNWTLNRFPD